MSLEELMAALINRFKRKPPGSKITMVHRDYVRGIVEDKIASRAYTTIYQNTTDRPILVLVTSQHTPNAANERARAYAAIGTTSPGGSVVGFSGFLDAPGQCVLHGQIAFIVPSKYYYRVISEVTGGAANALNEWFEVEF